jgi:hypothetical protein
MVALFSVLLCGKCVSIHSLANTHYIYSILSHLTITKNKKPISFPSMLLCKLHTFLSRLFILINIREELSTLGVANAIVLDRGFFLPNHTVIFPEFLYKSLILL